MPVPKADKLRLGVLISGSGRTLQNFIELIRRGELNAEIALVISSLRTSRVSSEQEPPACRW